MEQANQYKYLVESLKLLAASYENQKEYLPQYSDVPDEVTSVFENAFILFPQLVENNMFSCPAIACVIRTYNKMNWCLRNIDLDSFNHPEWEKVRDFSKEALNVIGEPLSKPDITFI